MANKEERPYGRLTLSMHPDEHFFIGDHIRVELVAVEPGKRVRLCIQAPHDVVIDRAEVRHRKNMAKRRIARRLADEAAADDA